MPLNNWIFLLSIIIIIKSDIFFFARINVMMYQSIDNDLIFFFFFFINQRKNPNENKFDIYHNMYKMMDSSSSSDGLTTYKDCLFEREKCLKYSTFSFEFTWWSIYDNPVFQRNFRNTCTPSMYVEGWTMFLNFFYFFFWLSFAMNFEIVIFVLFCF